MFSRFALLTMLAFGCGMVVPVPQSVFAFFAEKSHDGKVVSITAGANGADGKLVMTDKDGKQEHTHAISKTVKITLDKKDVVLTELKTGDAVKVTTDDNGIVTAVAASREKA